MNVFCSQHHLSWWHLIDFWINLLFFQPRVEKILLLTITLSSVWFPLQEFISGSFSVHISSSQESSKTVESHPSVFQYCWLVDSVNHFLHKCIILILILQTFYLKKNSLRSRWLLKYERNIFVVSLCLVSGINGKVFLWDTVNRVTSLAEVIKPQRWKTWAGFALPCQTYVCLILIM